MAISPTRKFEINQAFQQAFGSSGFDIASAIDQAITDALLDNVIAGDGELANFVTTSQKGAASGVATLDVSSKVPANQLNPPAMPNPARNIWAGSATYPTIASAIAAAEALAGSAETDVEGVTVHVPAGFWNETVTIRKNVSLKGDGSGSTRLAGATYRPSTALLAPNHCRMYGLTVDNLVIDNETAPASGVFNREYLFQSSDIISFHAKACHVKAWNIKNAFYMAFEDCQLGDSNSEDLISLNVNRIGCRNCSFASHVLHTLDSTAPNKAFFLVDPEDPLSESLDGTFAVSCCVTYNEFNIRTGAGSDPAFYRGVLIAESSFLGEIDLGPNTASGIRATGYFTLVADPLASLGLNCMIGFTPTTAGDWTAPPQSVDAALDELAARVKALEP